MHRLGVLTLAAGLMGVFPASAGAVSSDLLDLSVRDRDTGRVLEEYPWRGRTYVAGNPGNRYEVRLTNRTGGRVLVVLSIDGVNAITGETASPRQSGYVLEPYGTVGIEGWRKSLSESAAFVFSSLPDSYAAQTDRPDNVGVIGAAVFRERRTTPPPVVYRQRGDEAAPAAAPAPQGGAAESRSAQKSEAPERLGTGHGERAWDPVTQTSFERASARPDATLTLDYDRRERLEEAGIVRRWRDRRDPNPFPGGFVPDPPHR